MFGNSEGRRKKKSLTMLFFFDIMQAVFGKGRCRESPYLARHDAETYKMCRSLIEGDVTVTAAAAEGAEGPFCLETVDTTVASLFFRSTSSLITAMMGTISVGYGRSNESCRPHH